jgi:drug/metabolite transporter (DMT)-like permease
MKTSNWIIYAAITTIFWGVWGAFIEIPEKAGFPATLGYCAWALTMIPCALYALRLTAWRIDVSKSAVVYGALIGLLGAGGQLILFKALETGPAYIVFPLISLSPVITIVFSCVFLKEKGSTRQWIGIVFSLIAIFILSYKDPTDHEGLNFGWVVSSILVFFMWGAQGYYMKVANGTMNAESIFFYMAVSGLLFIPYAIYITDFSESINWGFSGAYSALLIQSLNAFGALMLVYAYRYGKAIVVSPVTAALAPIITVVISLLIYSVTPGILVSFGMVLALVAVFLMA